jgi:ribonuclease PH
MTHRSARPDGRRPDELRPVSFIVGYVDYPEGSVLIELGRTRVLCTSVDLNVVTMEGGRLAEVQGTAERAPFSRATLDHMPDLAVEGIAHLVRRQREALV